MRQGSVRIGIDLGGTKIEGIALAESGETLWRRRISAPKGSYPNTLEAIVALVTECETDLNIKASVGVGIPGVICKTTHKVKNANSTWLNGQPLEQDLGQRLLRPVRSANDANCFALSEAVDGSAANFDLVFGAILGTGCGAGLVFNHQIHAGPNNVAGEWGHNPLPWMNKQEFPGPDCFCGRQGCIETFVSGTGLERQYRELTTAKLSGQEILSLVEGGDPAATQVFEHYLEQLTRALAHVINVMDPDCIILGGGMSNIAPFYVQIPKRLHRYVIGGECHTPVLKAKYGDASGVRGAAWLWELSA